MYIYVSRCCNHTGKRDEGSCGAIGDERGEAGEGVGDGVDDGFFFHPCVCYCALAPSHRSLSRVVCWVCVYVIL